VDSSASRKRSAVLTPDTFNQLLGWLDGDRECAGRRYEEIRSVLIKIFACRGCATPDELADETINRVAGKISQIAPTYSGNPALYFYGVADKIFLEYIRRRPTPFQPAPCISTEEAELRYGCLEHCMDGLPAKSRELILAYYGNDESEKIKHRKELAEQTGIGANALWIRVHRIRETLKKCVRQCLSKGPPSAGNTHSRGPCGILRKTDGADTAAN